MPRARATVRAARRIASLIMSEEMLAPETGVTRDKPIEVGPFDADDQDRLVMLANRRAGDDAGEIEPDHDVEGLARIAHRAQDFVSREHVALQGPVPEDRGRRWLARRALRILGAGEPPPAQRP